MSTIPVVEVTSVVIVAADSAHPNASGEGSSVGGIWGFRLRVRVSAPGGGGSWLAVVGGCGGPILSQVLLASPSNRPQHRVRRNKRKKMRVSGEDYFVHTGMVIVDFDIRAVVLLPRALLQCSVAVRSLVLI